MYGRDYQDKTLSFEASGGLVNSALIMQDKQTDTYWSIMSGKGEAGELRGQRLAELPVGQKMMWRDWVARHPETLVLTSRGIQDPRRSSYDRYFRDSRGFRGAVARDDRLETKAPIFAFIHNERPHAIDQSGSINGRRYKIDGGLHVFLFRNRDDEIFRGSAAFRSAAGFEKRGGVWIELSSGARFDEQKREFIGGEVQRLNGFDTFWYSWSLTNPNTKLLR